MTNSSDFQIKDGVLLKYTGDSSNIVLPEGITEIGQFAITSNERIKSIKLSSTVQKIDESSFLCGQCLKNIYCDEKNKTFTSIDGILYSKDKSLLVAVPEGVEDNFEIKSFVKEIGCFAFTDCKNITKIKIPSNVTKIGINAFTTCNNLKDIYISESVNEIGNDAFIDCESLTIHGVKGSYAQFFCEINNITFAPL